MLLSFQRKQLVGCLSLVLSLPPTAVADAPTSPAASDHQMQTVPTQERRIEASHFETSHRETFHRETFHRETSQHETSQIETMLVLGEDVRLELEAEQANQTRFTGKRTVNIVPSASVDATEITP
jgi:hypothetical protein